MSGSYVRVFVYRPQKAVARMSMGRWGKPEDVGWAAAYLASDEAAFVTGQTIAV